MKVADNNVGLAGDLSHRRHARETEHDARSLVVAILICVACWAALGYFLLS